MEQPSTSNPVDELRDRLRNEIREIRNEKRFAEFGKKRLHLNEVLKELQDVTLAEVQCLAVKMRNPRSNEVEALTKLRKAFSQGQEFISAFLGTGGALQGLIGLLTGQHAESQLEATGCIINLLTADHRTTKSVAKASSPYLILYLSSSSVHLQELSAWALGNIAGDCISCATTLQNQQFIPSMLPLLQSPRTRVVHSAVYALSSFIKCLPNESNSILDKGLGSELPKFLVSLRSSSALTDVLLLLFRLSTVGTCDAYLLESTFIKECFRILQEALEVGSDIVKTRVITLVVRILANVGSVKESCNVILAVREAGDCFHRLLQFPVEHVVKETLWLLANLASHNDVILNDFFTANQILISSAYDKLSDKTQTSPSIIEHVLVFLCNVSRSFLEGEVQSEVVKSRLANLFPLLEIPRSNDNISKLSLHLSLLLVQQTSDPHDVLNESQRLNTLHFQLGESLR